MEKLKKIIKIIIGVIITIGAGLLALFIHRDFNKNDSDVIKENEEIIKKEKKEGKENEKAHNESNDNYLDIISGKGK